MSFALPLALGVSAAQATVDADNPWPGLESFRERDEPFFRGRDAEAAELARRVRRERLCVLYGVSGLGKSSLLQAGLFPRLREHLFLPVPIRLAHHEGASPPRVQVLEALAAQAAAHGVEAPRADPSETLWEFFHREDHAFWTPDNRPAVPLLVFDQFEEAFTLGRATREMELRTAAFLEELGDLIEGRPSRELKARLDAGEVSPREFAAGRHAYKVLLVLREDFLAEVDALARMVPAVMTNRMRLEPLSGTAALLVTAAGGPGLVPPEVGGRIVRLVAGGRGDDPPVPLEELGVDPALLSLFCRELNERRRALGRDSITGDLVEGNREGILADYYARSIADLDPGVRLLVEERLLTVGGHRNSEALENALAQPGVTEAALEALIGRRLVRREHRDRRAQLELTHDVLTGVVGQSRDRRRAEEAAEAATRAETARAERETARARARARKERERAELQRRAAAAARRQARVAAAAALLVLVLAALAGLTARRAVRAEEAANEARGAAERERNEAERQRRAAVGESERRRVSEQEARTARDQAQAALAALTDTARAMRAAQDSVRQKAAEAEARRIEAMVEREAADHYLGITGSLHTRQFLQDSVFQERFQGKLAQLDSVRAAAVARQREAETLRARSERRLGVIECALASEGPLTEAAQADTAALRQARRYVERVLRSSSLAGVACGPRSAKSGEAP